MRGRISPITDLTQFKFLLGQLDGPLCVAFSGGGDSMALLHMSVQASAAPVQALIVNHRLQAASDATSQKAAAMAKSVGAVAHILNWEHGPVTSGLQEQARLARYDLLGNAVRALGGDSLLLGHTRDDLAETLYMRLTQGSGWRGLSPMRAFQNAPVWPALRGVHVVRPLLAASRQSLRDYNKGQNLSWIDDPANDNTTFLRVQVRRALNAQPAIKSQLFSIAAMAAEPRDTETRILDDLKVLHTRTLPGGALQIFDLKNISDILLRTLVRAAIQTVSGAQYALPQRRIPPHIQDVTKLSLGGCLIASHDGDTLTICREPSAILGRMDNGPITGLVMDRETKIWDGRFEMQTRERGMSVRPVWPARDQLDKNAKAALKPYLPDVRRTLPGFFEADRLVAAPSLGFYAGTGLFLAENLIPARWASQ